MTANSSARREWLVPTALVLLSAIPVIAGAARITELTDGAPVTPDNARFVAMPLPVVMHIIGATVYCLLGAFQFASGFRRRRPGWHRAAGRILVPSGIIAALAGLWMTLFYPRPADVGDLVEGIRVVFGSAMVLSIVLGLAAIRRRDITGHRAWMMRGYAIALAAGTQAFTQLPWILIVGPTGKLSKATLMFLGWAINLGVAEWVIRRRPNRPVQATTDHQPVLPALVSK
jgi:uncharacterized membrane protein